MFERNATRLIMHDVRRTTQVLEMAAGDLKDEFLQYLYGMAIIHLNERLEAKHDQKRDAAPNKSTGV